VRLIVSQYISTGKFTNKWYNILVMNESNNFRLEANKWVIKTRWFYIFLLGGVCIILNWKNFLAINLGDFSWLKAPLVFLFALALASNLLLYIVSQIIKLDIKHRYVSLLSFFEIVFEIVFISLLMCDLSNGLNIVSVLLFIPILESIVLFGLAGPFVVAVCSGITLNILMFIHDSNLSPFLLEQTKSFRFDILKNSTIFTTTVVFSIAYLVVGFISSYVSKQIISREKNLQEETTNREIQMDSLRNFNKELAKGTREIEAKDFELEMDNRRLEELESAKSKFVAVTAHQLRTPLSAIKWTFEIILGGKLGVINDEQKEFLTKGFESAQRMIYIVNDLLHVDNIDVDKLKLNIEKINLNSLLESVGFEFTNQSISKEISFKIKKPAKSLPDIEGDQVRLRIVLENLLDNAINYTPKGGKVVLSVSDAKLNTAGAVIEIIVTDSGIGIPESVKSKIFGKFFRAENAIQIEPNGTGVGLFISKDIIEKHGGSLWYESSVGKGTSFHITLPLSQKSTSGK